MVAKELPLEKLATKIDSLLECWTFRLMYVHTRTYICIYGKIKNLIVAQHLAAALMAATCNLPLEMLEDLNTHRYLCSPPLVSTAHCVPSTDHSNDQRKFYAIAACNMPHALSCSINAIAMA